MKKQILVLMTLILGVMVFGGLVMAAEGQTVNANTAASVNVPGWIEVSVNNIPISFGDLSPGYTNVTTNVTVTVESATNVLVFIKVRGETANLNPSPNYAFCVGTYGGACGVSTAIPLSNLKWKRVGPLPEDGPTSYQTSADPGVGVVCSSLSVSNICTIQHSLTINDATPSEHYFAGVIITAKASA